jgi:hypothetical protein
VDVTSALQTLQDTLSTHKHLGVQIAKVNATTLNYYRIHLEMVSPPAKLLVVANPSTTLAH